MTLRRGIARRPAAVVRAGPRRRTDWEDTNFNFATGAGTTAILQLTPAGDNQGRTVTRVLLTLILQPSNPIVAESMMQVHFGIGMSSSEAIGTSASLADPAVANENPVNGWLLRDYVTVVDHATVVAVAPIRLTYDLRAQRRIDEGLLYMRLTNGSGLGPGFTVQMSGIVRCLVLLP